MAGNLTPLIIFIFLIFYIFFRRESACKLKRNLPFEKDLTSTEKYFKVNNNLSLICIISSLLVCSFPALQSYLFMFKIYKVELISAIGTLFVKLSFIWLIVCGIQVSDKLDFLFQPITAEKICKMETAMITGVVLLSIGVLFSIPSVATLLISSLSIASFVISIKKYRI